MQKRSLLTRRAALLTGAGAIAGPFVMTTPGFGQTGPIKIAGLVSLTGSGSPFGPNSKLAHQAVVDQVNAAGGLLGRQLEYIAEDDQTNAEAGVRAARKLIDVDKVQTIMSVWASAAPACRSSWRRARAGTRRRASHAARCWAGCGSNSPGAAAG